MNLIVERVDVWAARMADRPGGLAEVLKPLQAAGADLDLLIARRAPDSPGLGAVFVAPLRRPAEKAAAASAGFNVANRIHSVRIQGQNAPGLAAEVAGKLGEAGISLRGVSAAELGTRFVMYIALDSEEEAEKTVRVLQSQSSADDSGLSQSAA